MYWSVFNQSISSISSALLSTWQLARSLIFMLVAKRLVVQISTAQGCQIKLNEIHRRVVLLWIILLHDVCISSYLCLHTWIIFLLTNRQLSDITSTCEYISQSKYRYLYYKERLEVFQQKNWKMRCHILIHWYYVNIAYFPVLCHKIYGTNLFSGDKCVLFKCMHCKVFFMQIEGHFLCFLLLKSSLSIINEDN